MVGDISNFIFDLGGVLINYQPREYLEEFVDSTKVDVLLKIIFQSSEWIELDRGTLSEDEAIEIWCDKNPSYANEIKLVMKNWMDMLTPKLENIKFLELLKVEGYKLFVLSNFHEKAFNFISQKYDFLKLFDGMTISFKVKMVKPESQIYKSLIREYGLNPFLSLFIDDSEENIKTAERENLRTFLFTSDEEFQRFIQNFLGGVSIET